MKTNKLRQHLNLPKNSRIALYQGNIQPDRGLERLVRAAAYLEPENVIVIMGQNIGTTRMELAQLITLQQVHEHIKIIPPVPYKDLLSWTASADIGLTIIPLDYTRNMRTCLPNKLFEYIQAGLPVLSSPLEAVREILTTYDVGNIVRSMDPADVGMAINTMLSQPDELARMRANALQAAQQDLCWEKESQKLLRLYQQFLAN
ncbi:glycosyltransferase [Dictyobacter kobayashii]|uniref:glycosyltransferase n=1 Tax=Dictyobacter kobayashii TaxID=2014872 RepID=UPI00138705A0|nr:glycosyltransferase [Dictyobacter kobayashii]